MHGCATTNNPDPPNRFPTPFPCSASPRKSCFASAFNLVLFLLLMLRSDGEGVLSGKNA